MSTASKLTATKLIISETKTLDTFDIISPLVETSKSKLSPLSSSEAINSPSTFATAEASNATGGALKLPASSPALGSSRTLHDNRTTPFLNESFRKQQQPHNEEIPLQNIKNMLASTSTNNNSTNGSIQKSASARTPATNSSSSPNSIKIKCESFSTPSPSNENANSQNILEENCNNINNNTTNSNNAMAIDSAIRERESASTTSSMLRQNSNSSINSGPVTAAASSPNNGSDHSNSSNISSNVSQTAVDSNADMQDISMEKATKKKISGTNVKDEDYGKNTTSDKSNSSGSSKNNLCPTPTLKPLATVKEDPDIMSNLINVKKEDNTVSPDMSPVGFGSIPNLSGGAAESGGRSVSPAKVNELSNTAVNNSTNGNEKLTSGVGTLSTCGEDAVPGANLNIAANEGNGNSGGDVAGGNGITQQSGTILSNSSANGPVGNCMDYMQQQNHIFVFSTQLANKGAESVLSGQFPTIIAYHCTQPATKSFLEDFFIRNPMKMTKLQRQNSINICNISMASNQAWVNSGSSINTMSKIQQKSNGGKINYSPLNANIENKSIVGGPNALRPSNLAAFGGSTDAMASENELMCWEQTRNSLENASAADIKMLDSVEAAVSSVGNQITNKAVVQPTDVGISDGSILSLQGVKVPDENLTPQQRQHREEQLAKLKKINQILFSENGSDFRSEGNAMQGPNQMGKLGSDGVPSNLSGIMLNMAVSSAGIGGPGGQINSAMRNVVGNSITQQNKQATNCNPESIAAGIDDPIAPSDIMSSHELSGLQCNTTKGAGMPLNNQTNMPCGSSGIMSAVAPNVSVGNISGSSLPCGGGITGSLMGTSSEIISGFNQTCGDGNISSSGQSKNMGPGVMHSQDSNQVGMAQIEWSKLQHQFFEERVKTNKSGADIGCIPNTICRSNSSGMGVMLRPNISGGGPCVATATTPGSQGAVRSVQGPPPPYHPTQRSASVPIATQSPNPASPNNPTSNLSLPSPRASGALGILAHSPNMDAHASTMAVTSTISVVTTTTSTLSSTLPNSNVNQAKNSFQQQEGSPTNGSCGSNNNTGNSNRNRGNLTQFNSNPSTPLSHMSPKDLDSFHVNTSTGELKNARPSPQRSRTPLVGANGSNVNETTNIEARFPSPGLNFPPHMPNIPGGVSNYKGPGPLERQNSAPMPSQFCRRTDNLPLNPNSSRAAQNKLSHSFDPISSLAQMSQQLTSCVPLNAGVGNSPSGIGVIGGNDMNMSSNVNPNIDGMMVSLDAGMDHCNTVSGGGNINMPPHISGAAGPFISNNCHINSMMGSRLLNPKVCTGFNPSNGGVRDGPGNFHGVMSHRMMGRMAVNFGNFNSPNVQVKASMPNTIQYMPVRPQNNTNMRVPPNLEFLPRYANPQISSGVGNAGGLMDNALMASGGNPGTSTDPSKIANNPNNVAPGGNSGINFFQNCNQLGSIVVEQDDMPGPGMIPSHDLSLSSHTSMIRGIRPMRQHAMGHGSHPTTVGPRMQGPTGSVMSQFSGAPQDSIECTDSAATMFAAGSAGQMYVTGGQQLKSMKGMQGGMCLNMNTINSGSNGQVPNSSPLMQNDHNSTMQSPVSGPIMLGPNTNVMPNTLQVGSNSSPVSGACSGNNGNGNVNYKPFVGPSSNDLKYAQQYHSFQQQLYATSTRSQQGGGNTTLANNANANPAFFVNK